MTIHIEELSFECIIGILEFERIEAQSVIININIDYNYKDENFINYADVITLVQEDMINNQYELLETALEKLATKLHKKYSKIETLSIKITKPNIIDNAKVSLSKIFKFS